MTAPTFRRIPWQIWAGMNNGMTKEDHVYNDGQTMEEAQAYFERQNPGHFVDVRRAIITNNISAFVATIYN